MNKQKIKDFMSAFEECDQIERAHIIIELTRVQKTDRHTLSECQVKLHERTEELMRLDEENQQLQTENNFLTLKVAELQMAQNMVFLAQKIRLNINSIHAAENEKYLAELHEIDLSDEHARREVKSLIAGYGKAIIQAQSVIDAAFSEFEQKSELPKWIKSEPGFAWFRDEHGNEFKLPRRKDSLETTTENATIANIDPLPNAGPAVFMSDSDLGKLREIAQKRLTLVGFDDTTKKEPVNNEKESDAFAENGLIDEYHLHPANSKTSLHKKENPDKWKK